MESPFSDLPEDVLGVLGALLPAGDAQTVAAASAVARSWRRRVPEAWACDGDDGRRGARGGGGGNDEDGDDGDEDGGAGGDSPFGRPPLVDLDASAPDFLDRCAALGRLMPRGISSARILLPGRRAVAAGAPPAPRVLAAFFLSGHGNGRRRGCLRHLTLHLEEDGVELFEDDDEEEEVGEGGAAGGSLAARPAAALPGGNDDANNSGGNAGAAPPRPLPPPPPHHHLSSLRSLAVTGGALSPQGTARLLRALARACPRLEALRLLPDDDPSRGAAAAPGAGGLSDADVPLLVALAAAAPSLATVEFAAGGSGGGGGRGGFTGAGLIAVARGLPALRALRVHRLAALAAVAAADSRCFAERPCLRELHLGCDAPLPPAAARRLAAAAGGLSMRFRWAEPPALLRTATVALAGALLRLDLGVVRLPAGDAAAAGRFVGCLGALTRLRSLRCAVTTTGAAAEGGGGGYEGHEGEEGDDGDARVATLDLAGLARLTDLRSLDLAKQAAWSVPAGTGDAAAAPPQPFQHGRFVAPSLSIPLSPGGAGALASSCARLRSLRLRLSRRDVSAEGLACLSRFSRLEALSLVVDGHGHGSSSSSSSGGGASAAAAGPLPAMSSWLPTGVSLGGGFASGSPPSSSSFMHATALVPLDLLDLPPTLASLHLCRVGISTPAAALQALSPAAPPDGAGPRAADEYGAAAAADGAEAASFFPPPAPAPPASTSSPPGPRRLSRLADLDLEQCRLRPAQLAALASAAGPSLRRLRLCGVAGLSDEALLGLAAATGLRELAVEAAGNALVTQRGLLRLGGLPLARPLRRLTWRSDDLSRLGPVLAAYAAFTALRALSLSCTRAAAERGARLRRASQAGAAAGGGGAVAALAPLQPPPPFFFSSCAQQQQQQQQQESPVDALRALLPLASLEFAGAAAMAPLRAAAGGAAAAAGAAAGPAAAAPM